MAAQGSSSTTYCHIQRELNYIQQHCSNLPGNPFQDFHYESGKCSFAFQGQETKKVYTYSAVDELPECYQWEKANVVKSSKSEAELSYTHKSFTQMFIQTARELKVDLPAELDGDSSDTDEYELSTDSEDQASESGEHFAMDSDDHPHHEDLSLNLDTATIAKIREEVDYINEQFGEIHDTPVATMRVETGLGSVIVILMLDTSFIHSDILSVWKLYPNEPIRLSLSIPSYRTGSIPDVKVCQPSTYYQERQEVVIVQLRNIIQTFLKATWDINKKRTKEQEEKTAEADKDISVASTSQAREGQPPASTSRAYDGQSDADNGKTTSAEEGNTLAKQPGKNEIASETRANTNVPVSQPPPTVNQPISRMLTFFGRDIFGELRAMLADTLLKHGRLVAKKETPRQPNHQASPSTSQATRGPFQRPGNALQGDDDEEQSRGDATPSVVSSRSRRKQSITALQRGGSSIIKPGNTVSGEKQINEANKTSADKATESDSKSDLQAQTSQSDPTVQNQKMSSTDLKNSRHAKSYDTLSQTQLSKAGGEDIPKQKKPQDELTVPARGGSSSDLSSSDFSSKSDALALCEELDDGSAKPADIVDNFLSSQNTDVSFPASGPYLFKLLAYAKKRVATINAYCVVCDRCLSLDATSLLKPAVCERDLCTFTFLSLGIIRHSVGELVKSADVIDLLVELAISACMTPLHKKSCLFPYPQVVDPDNPQILAFDPKKKENGKVLSCLKNIPRFDDVSKSYEKLKDEIMKIDRLAYPLLEWLINSNRSHIVKLPSDYSMSTLGCGQQYLLRSAPPQQEIAFMNARKHHGSLFAFHGSPFSNWHSIMRRGLMVGCNEEGEVSRLHGANFGKGIYLSPSWQFSSQYSCRGSERLDAARQTICMALCEVINNDKLRKCHQDVWVMTEPQYVCTRFFLVYRGSNEYPGKKLKSTNLRVQADIKKALGFSQ